MSYSSMSAPAPIDAVTPPRCECPVCSLRAKVSRVVNSVAAVSSRMIAPRCAAATTTWFDCVAGVAVVAPVTFFVASATGLALRQLSVDNAVAVSVSIANTMGAPKRNAATTLVWTGALAAAALGLSYAPLHGYLASTARSALHRAMVFGTAGALTSYMVVKALQARMPLLAYHAKQLVRAKYPEKIPIWDIDSYFITSTWSGAAMGALGVFVGVGAFFALVEVYDKVMNSISRDAYALVRDVSPCTRPHTPRADTHTSSPTTAALHASVDTTADAATFADAADSAQMDENEEDDRVDATEERIERMVRDCVARALATGDEYHHQQ